MKINYNVTDIFHEDKVAQKENVQKKLVEIIQTKCYNADGVVISLNGGMAIE